jgi:hypothetical protein
VGDSRKKAGDPGPSIRNTPMKTTAHIPIDSGRYVISLFLLLLFVSLRLTGCEGAGVEAERKWTLIGYFNGNNAFDTEQSEHSRVISELQMLEKVGSTSRIDIVALLASMNTGGTARIYHVERVDSEFPDLIRSPVLEDRGDTDMSDSKTFGDFVCWCRDNYPAERYMLMVADHGAGWLGSCRDELHGDGMSMTMPGMRQALEACGVRFEVIFFAAPLMGQVEVACELGDLCDHFAAAENTGYPRSPLFPGWLRALTENPDLTALNVAESIVDDVIDAGRADDIPVTMSVFDMARIEGFTGKVAEFANSLAVHGMQDIQYVADARSKAHQQEYDDEEFMDLKLFVQSVSQDPAFEEIAPISNSADSLIHCFDSFIPYTRSNTATPRGGASIYFPVLEYNPSYENLKFTDTGWNNLVELFVEEGGGREGIIISGTVTFPEHVLSDFCIAFVDTFHTDRITFAHLAPVDPVTGTYTIEIDTRKNIEAYIEAWDNIDDDFTIDDGEGFGYYDANDNDLWDDLEVWEAGAAYENIDIVLEPWSSSPPGEKNVAKRR